MAVSLLSGFPVVASKAHNTTMTLATASHSASGACLLVLCLSAENAFNAITNITISDTIGGLTWTKQLEKRWSSGTGFQDYGWSQVWTAVCSSAYTSKTVTMTVTAGSNNMMAAMSLSAVTGYDTSTPVGASNGGQATTDGTSHLIASALTAQTTGGMIFGTGMNGNSSVTMSMQSGTTQDVQVSDGGVGTSIACFRKTATTTASSSYTVGTTSTDQYYTYASIEVRDGGTSTVTGTVAATAGNPTPSIAGGHGPRAAVSATAGNPTLAASGSTVVGSAAATAGNPTLSAAGAHGVAGSVAATAGNPTAAAAGAVGASGSVSATAGNPSLSSSGSTVVGSVAAQAGDPTLSSSGQVMTGGSVNATAGNPTLAATGTHVPPISGSVSAQAGNPTLAAAGTVSGSSVTGTVNAQGGNPTAAITGVASQSITGEVAAQAGNPSSIIRGHFGDELPSLDGLLLVPYGETIVSALDDEPKLTDSGETRAVFTRN